MTRREFMVAAQKDRNEWAKKVDRESYDKFVASCSARYSDGKRK